jgi:surface antigen
VEASCGAVVELTGCTVSDCLEGNGLDAKDKGTHVVAKKTQFQGNFKGVVVVGPASVQLDKSTAASKKDSNVKAARAAVVELVGCTVAGCFGGNGVYAEDKGTSVQAKETKFQGNLNGVVVSDKASLQLDKCMVTSNKDSNVKASCRAVVSLKGCTVTNCLEGNGLEAKDKSTYVEANETIWNACSKGT